MLEIILMLLGIAFPNSEINKKETSYNLQTQTTLSVASDVDDTGGNNAQRPPTIQ